MPPRLPLPQTAQAISSEWLGQALGRDISACRLLDAHTGTTGRALLELDCAGPDPLPSRLFAKLPPPDPAQRAFVVSSGMGGREARFYCSLADEVPVRVPRCYFADWDAGGEHYLMLLEYLDDSDCRFRNAGRRYSPGYVRSLLAAFARLHAAYWDSARFQGDLGWLEPPLQHPVAPRLIQRALVEHATRMPPVFTALGELYIAHTDAIHRLWSLGAPTLIHGDVHDGNLFFDGDTPGFVDWALVARGPGMRDVGYFLAATLNPDDQREQARELLSYYREQLQSHGVVAPPMQELWRQYQWHAAYVWVGAVTTLAMGDAWQPVSYVRRSLERLHPALAYLDTVGALRAALQAT